MLFHPAIIALLIASAVTAVMLTGASVFGVQVVRRWDMSSGSELQLTMERRTYLISTLLNFVFLTELLSVMLFVFTGEKLSVMFVGAMCAVGTFNANAYGFPALILKLALFFVAAAWLALNYVDNKGYDYPLVRLKYSALLLIAPLALATGAVQLLYFLNLEADVITSCCGSLFGSDADTVTGELSGLPPGPAMTAYFAVLAAAVGWGAWVWKKGSGATLFAGISIAALAMTLTGVISFLSLYVYEHPHHHCPFCLLKPEYDFVGYLLYVPLFAATGLGLGAGVIAPFKGRDSLVAVVPELSKRLAGWSAGLYLLVIVVSIWLIARSNLLLLDNVGVGH